MEQPETQNENSSGEEQSLENENFVEIHDPDERSLLFSYKEPTLPDSSLISGRLLIAAWDEGLGESQ